MQNEAKLFIESGLQLTLNEIVIYIYICLLKSLAFLSNLQQSHEYFPFVDKRSKALFLKIWYEILRYINIRVFELLDPIFRQSVHSSLSKKFLYKPFLFEKSLPNYTQKSISFQRKIREVLNEKELFLLKYKAHK